MIIQFDGKSYDTDKVSDEQAKRQLQAYVSQMAFNNQFQISLQKSNDKLQEELRPLLTDEALVEDTQPAKVATSKSSKTQKVFSILIFIILGESSDSSFYEGLYI